mmetsp:Transcript_59226/g.123703  ORF Transcript_59226/g.123703 Transcript_59226/m.123703 type:complete len:106 (-) Transcript_59226:300-617(-)
MSTPQSENAQTKNLMLGMLQRFHCGLLADSGCSSCRNNSPEQRELLFRHVLRTCPGFQMADNLGFDESIRFQNLSRKFDYLQLKESCRESVCFQPGLNIWRSGTV